MLYAITVHVGTISRDMTGSVSVPTFYLDENVQGITGPGMACEVARQIVDPLRLIGDRLHIHAVSMPLTEVSVATSGEYSDYQIEKIFARRADADAYLVADRVKDFEVQGGPVETRDWWSLTWNVQNPDRAHATEQWMLNPWEYSAPHDWDGKPDHVRHYWQDYHGDPFVLHVEGWDLQRVRKVYSEQRAQYIAAH